jgi:hypothetical protein
MACRKVKSRVANESRHVALINPLRLPSSPASLIFYFSGKSVKFTKCSPTTYEWKFGLFEEVQRALLAKFWMILFVVNLSHL